MIILHGKYILPVSSAPVAENDVVVVVAAEIGVAAGVDLALGTVLGVQFGSQ